MFAKSKIFNSFVIILFFTLLLTLTGCGQVTSQTANPASGEAEQTDTDVSSNQAESQENSDPTLTEESQSTATILPETSEETTNEEPEPTTAPPIEPAGSGITAELDITNWERVEAEGQRLDETVDCFERLFASGRFVLFEDGSLTYTPADGSAIGDCLALDETELHGDFEPSDEADYAYEIDDIKQFVGLNDVEIDADGTITGDAEGTLRIRVYPGSGEDRTRIQMIRADYLFNGTTVAESSTPIEYALTDALATSGAPITVLPPPKNPFTVINDIRLEFVTNLTFAEVKAFYEQNLAGLGWTLDSQSDNALNFVTDDSRDYGSIRAEEYVRTIVELNLINSLVLDELITVPLPNDALVGSLMYFQVYDLPADDVSGYLESINTQLESNGWTLVSSEATDAGQDNLWEQADQTISVQQVESDRFENGVRLAYNFAEPIVAVNLDDVRNGVVADGQEETIVTSDSSLPPVNPADFPEEIVLASGSTYFFVAEQTAVQYGDAGGGPVWINSGGASSAIASLCEQIVDGAVVHRPLNEAERTNCESSGAQVVEFVIGNNRTAVLIHPDNTWATSMTVDELRVAFTTAETWADVNPAWPDSPIQRFLPGSDSGIFNNFIALVFDGDESGVFAASTLNFSEDDNVLLNAVESNVDALALINLAFAQERSVDATAVAIDGIAPDEAGYLLNSPVFVYTLDNILTAKPQVAAFMNFMLVNSPQIVQDNRFLLPIDTATQQVNEQAWLDIVGE